MIRNVPPRGDPCCQRLREVRIDEKPHAALARADEDRVIDLGSSVLQACSDVGWFEEGVILENFRLGSAAGQHVQHIFDTQPIAADARATAAFVGFEGDPVEFTGHGLSMWGCGRFSQPQRRAWFQILLA